MITVSQFVGIYSQMKIFNFIIEFYSIHISTYLSLSIMFKIVGGAHAMRYLTMSL